VSIDELSPSGRATSGVTTQPAGNARERILGTAYDLFSRHGIRAVGVDRVVAEAGVAKTTLYRHFPSKDALVVAVLGLREERWSRDWLQHNVEQRGGPARARLLAIFDLFGEWFGRKDYEGCLFCRTLLELGDRTSAPGAASVAALANIETWLIALAEEAGVKDPVGFAGRWQLLMFGSLISAAAGHVDAAAQAGRVGSLLLERELPGGEPGSVFEPGS
jgi:AcrR family transcriptional regulator